MVLKNEKEIEVLINPLISPYQNKAMEPPEGQIASAKWIWQNFPPKQLYWVHGKRHTG